MGDWYAVGVFAGIGVALGIAAVAAFGGSRLARAAPLLAAVAGAALGFALGDIEDAVAGGLGGLLGGAGMLQLVSGALRRGATRLATALLLVVVALGMAAIAFIPVVGYLEAIVLPVLGMRMRKRGVKRHAGLRTLAKD
jgi:hypothetical protein